MGKFHIAGRFSRLLFLVSIWMLMAIPLQAQTAPPQLERIVEKAVHAIPKEASVSANILEALYPGYPQDPVFQSWLALGLARVGYAQEAVEAINSVLEKHGVLEPPSAERLVDAACEMNQHTLARAAAWRVTGDQVERNRLTDKASEDLKSKASGISYTETVDRMKAAGAFANAGSLEPSTASFEGYPGKVEAVYLQHKPAGSNRFPAVVMFPGGAPIDQPPPPGDIDSELFDFALQFVKAGYCALIVKPRAWNGGEGVYLSDKSAARDLVKGAAFLAKRPEIRADSIFAVGQGSAGTAVLWALMVDGAQLAGGVAFAPQSYPYNTDFINGGTPYAHFRSGYLQFRSPASSIKDLLFPVLVVHGTEDLTVPVEQTHRLEGVAKAENAPVSFAIVNGAGHDDILKGDGFSRALDFLRSLTHANGR